MESDYSGRLASLHFNEIPKFVNVPPRGFTVNGNSKCQMEGQLGSCLLAVLRTGAGRAMGEAPMAADHTAVAISCP